MTYEFPPPIARNYERLLKRWTLLFPAYLKLIAHFENINFLPVNIQFTIFTYQLF